MFLLFLNLSRKAIQYFIQFFIQILNFIEEIKVTF